MTARAWIVAAIVGLTTGCRTGTAVWIVDRIEGEAAVLLDEHGEQRAVPLGDLPGGTAEGDALADNRLDDEEAQWLRSECERRRRRLIGEDDGADFSLEETP